MATIQSENTEKAPIPVCAIVATWNRPLLLGNRSLPSIIGQTKLPDFLIVVDDSTWRTKRTNKEVVAALSSKGIRTVYLENWRTPGAAGAWNTAFQYLIRTIGKCWIALLDDDDEWESEYLERCLGAANRESADIVISGLIRQTGHERRPHPLPTGNIGHHDFLVGNPHWQGSNTFLTLNTILAAGGFDESLESTNDRDLGMRLLDMPWLHWTVVREHLVVHHTLDGYLRLSAPGSERKQSGLKGFHAKYSGRMTEDQRAEFSTRARTLFGISDEIFRFAPETPRPIPCSCQQRFQSSGFQRFQSSAF